MSKKNPTACLLVIGNEVLSGRTRDANIQFLATGLGNKGIPLREVRVIPDVPETIIATVNEVRAKFDDVFTTGGHHQRVHRRGVRRAVGASSGGVAPYGSQLQAR
jgi:molybdopterin biosynthesis enzyme MoaB